MTETDIFILITLVAIGVFDFYVIIRRGKQASISAWFIRNSKKHPSIAFLMGFVMGHLFWSMSEFSYTPKEEMKVKCEKFLEEIKK